ncbi:TPA: hypothetical protein QDB31_001735 [Burkholderia vietnamiensis]|nr:hypothetical protein [Burkholderia vietnamiensis]
MADRAAGWKLVRISAGDSAESDGGESLCGSEWIQHVGVERRWMDLIEMRQAARANAAFGAAATA